MKNTTPKLVKVYLKQHEVDALDYLAKRLKLSRSRLISTLLRATTIPEAKQADYAEGFLLPPVRLIK